MDDAIDSIEPSNRLDDLGSLLGPARLAFFTPIREYPPMADRKAIALLAGNALVASVVMFLSGGVSTTMSQSVMLASAMMGALVVLAVLVLAGGVFAYRALALAVPPMPEGLAFFPHIAARPLQDYRAAVVGLSYRQAIRIMLHYNYSLAIQSSGKFALLRTSTRCFRWAMPIWMGLLLALALFGAK